MTDRFLFGIIIYDIIIKNSKAKWREKDRKKIKGLDPGAIYHIMHRGVRRKPIFEDEMDHQVLLQIIRHH